MAIQWHSSFHDGVLYVETKGFDESLEEVVRYNQAILQEGLDNNAQKVLCDERQLEYRLPLIDTFELAEDLAKNVPYSIQIAMVTHPLNEQMILFWETVALNRGLNVKVFFDPKEAALWLHS